MLPTARFTAFTPQANTTEISISSLFFIILSEHFLIIAARIVNKLAYVFVAVVCVREGLI